MKEGEVWEVYQVCQPRRKGGGEGEGEGEGRERSPIWGYSEFQKLSKTIT